MPRILSKSIFSAIEALLKAGGQTQGEIASSVGVEKSVVCAIANGNHSYQSKSKKLRARKPYLPTPEEIKAECARLRAARDEDERPEAQDLEN